MGICKYERQRQRVRGGVIYGAIETCRREGGCKWRRWRRVGQPTRLTPNGVSSSGWGQSGRCRTRRMGDLLDAAPSAAPRPALIGDSDRTWPPAFLHEPPSVMTPIYHYHLI